VAGFRPIHYCRSHFISCFLRKALAAYSQRDRGRTEREKKERREMASRAIKDCTPSLQAKIKAFMIATLSAGIPVVITVTARTIKEQRALYAQGRELLFDVNALREMAGLPRIKQEQNKIVTWTLASKHIIDLDDGNPDNDKSRAFDIAIAPGGKPVWDIKVDVNQDHIPDYEQAGKIGEACGLRWGGRFKRPDMPHFEEA
jgi:peptidoglycan LD-endopeptidase CwlK